MALPPVVGLEIGTTKTVALVGEWREDNHVNIIGIGEQESAGIRKSQIVDFEKVCAGIRSVLATAEERSDVSIGEVVLAVDGARIRVDVNRGMVPVFDKSGEITQDDIEQVMDVASAVNLGSDREIIHTVNQHFYIDDSERVINPEGLRGARLSLDMLVFHGNRNGLANMLRAAESRQIDVQDMVFSGLCSALAVLTTEQKQSGVVVIDIGGGTTDYVVYLHGIVRTAGVFSLGGDHITNDIAHAFNIPMKQAERIKREYGSALVNDDDGTETVKIAAEVGFAGCEINRKALNQVINARTDEMLRKVERELQRASVIHQLGAGVVLTGGCANLEGLCTIGENVYGMPCSVGSPRNFVGLNLATAGPEYASACGLVQYGFRIAQEEKVTNGLSGWFKGLLGQ
ncbi:MAG: cell division protein FtsA [Candidatus Promineifilaceae bacterium]|jgi:cell division protein FtsA